MAHVSRRWWDIPLAVILILLLLFLVVPAKAQTPQCVSMQTIMLDLGKRQTAGHGATAYMDDEEAFLWLDAFNSIPPVTEFTAHTVVLFTFNQTVRHTHYGIIAEGSQEAFLFDETGCLSNVGVLSPSTVRQIGEILLPGDPV